MIAAAVVLALLVIAGLGWKFLGPGSRDGGPNPYTSAGEHNYPGKGGPGSGGAGEHGGMRGSPNSGGGPGSGGSPGSGSPGSGSPGTGSP